MTHTQKRPVARGCRHGDQRSHGLGFVCYFDDETAETIRLRAIREGTSFGAQVRLLVEWGLEAEEATP